MKKKGDEDTAAPEHVLCPICGRVLDPQPHPEKPGRLVAICECTGRAVYETDAPEKEND